MNSNYLKVIHLTCCLLAIAAGTKVMSGLFSGKLIEKWFLVFLRCSLAASLTGIFISFPFNQSLPMYWIALFSVYVAGVTIFAWRFIHRARIWRFICAFCIPVILCLNILLGVAQALNAIPVLRALSPTQNEPEYLTAQFVVLMLFVALGTIAAWRLRSRTYS